MFTIAARDRVLFSIPLPAFNIQLLVFSQILSHQSSSRIECLGCYMRRTYEVFTCFLRSVIFFDVEMGSVDFSYFLP